MKIKANKNEELKPCPFCGAKVSYMNIVTPIKMFYCTNYKECGAVVSFDNAACNTPADAPKIRAWNRRTSCQ